jgi:hypothetical protein
VFRCGNWAFNENSGYTVETKVQVTKYVGGNLGNDHGLMFQVYGPTQLMQIDLSPTQLLARNGKYTDGDFAGRAHIIRLVKHAGADLFDVFIDGTAAQVNIPTVRAGGNSITFGDTSTQRSVAAQIDYVRVDNTGAWTPGTEPTVSKLTVPTGISLTGKEENTIHGYSIALPATTTVTGDADNRQATVGGINIQLLYVPSGIRSLDGFLPVTSVTDTSDRTFVALDGGKRGTVYSYQLDPAAHPCMVNTNQQYLAIHVGGDNLLLISATGTPEAMKANAKVLLGIFTSVKLAK